MGFVGQVFGQYIIERMPDTIILSPHALFILVADVQYVTAYTSGREDTPYDRVWVTAPHKMFQFRVKASQNAYIMLAIEPYKVSKARTHVLSPCLTDFLEKSWIFLFHIITPAARTRRKFSKFTPRGNENIYSAHSWSISWLLMPQRRKEPGHQQPWCG